MKFLKFNIFLILTIFNSNLKSDIVNSDGTLKILPYEAGQLKDLENLYNDINLYHSRIEEKLNFLNSTGKIKNSEYLQDTKAIEETTLVEKKKFLINKRFILKVSKENGSRNLKLSSVSFWTRKALIGKTDQVFIEIDELKNENVGKGNNDSIELDITKTSASSKISKNYNLFNVREPKERIKIVRMYRTSLMDVMVTIERLVATMIESNKVEVSNTLNSFETSGEYRETPKIE